MKIGIRNTVSTNLRGIEQSAMNSLRGRRLRGGRGGGRGGSRFRARDKPESLAYARSCAQMLFPFPYERLSPMVCNKIEFHYASMRTMSLFPAIFAIFQMPEGLNFFSSIQHNLTTSLRGDY